MPESGKSEEEFFLTAPIAAMPTGGGALSSIGESFSTTLATGTARFSVPLGLSPGRNEFGPNVALVYDSGAGNGPFGLGWQLDLPSVRRKTSRGVPRYRDDDIFLVGNAEVVPTTIAGLGDEAVEDEQTYAVQRYRPRVEHAFARIERWTRRSDGDVHWRIFSADNQVTRLGTAPQSRITDPADDSRIAEWLVSSVHDDRGNIVRFEWTPEDGVGVDLDAVFEARRSPFAQRYLTRISYGNTEPYPGATDWESTNRWLFEAELDYGPADAVRPDPFSNFRYGFELRTYRLCREVRMVHDFPELAGPTVVRTVRFDHDLSPVATTLRAVEQVGHDGDATLRRPTLRLTYTSAEPSDTVQPATGLEFVPERPIAFFADLHGEGLAGVVHVDHGGLWYQRNLGSGMFAPAVAEPAPTLARGAFLLADIDGDGRPELLGLGDLSGYHDRRAGAFRPFESSPNVAWDDPNVRFVDVTGDGLADILITHDDCFTYHEGRGTDGFDEARRVATSLDEGDGPRVVFANGQEAIHLADMSGDGRVDIVRIFDGEVSYWPNLGRARFGPRVTMDRPPSFGRLDPERLRLADIDGSGTTDIVYLDEDGVSFWLNESGNAFSPATRLAIFPAADELTTIEVRDIDGSGLPSLVWGSSLPAAGAAPLRYVKLLNGGKPYLLTSVDNGMGSRTDIEYTPSTSFYLADAARGRPWKTRLGFPIQVVSRVQVHDLIRGNRFTTRHAYHHGYFDPTEREFAGFGLVETWDTEEFDELDEDIVPPQLTKTWHHVGTPVDVRDEWFQGDPAAYVLGAHEVPDGLSISEERQAHWAMRQFVVRREVYGLDGDEREAVPYVVSEHTARISVVQRTTAHATAVFHVSTRESITHDYEREATDPRVVHAFTLEVGPYGEPTKTAEIMYPRRGAVAELEQRTGSGTLTERSFEHVDTATDTWRLRVPTRERLFELDADTSRQVDISTLQELPDSARTLLGDERTRYYDDDLATPLSFGEVSARAIAFESYRLAVDDVQLGDPALAGRFTEDLLREAGYRNDIDDPATWWAASGRFTYAASGFVVPASMLDAFGNVTELGWDEHDLFVETTTDAFGVRTRLAHDYRVLQPHETTDGNGNGGRAAYDPLGLPVAIARYGSEGEGDTLDSPSVRIEYDWLAFERTRDDARPTPNYYDTSTREEHGADTRWQQRRTYLDGGLRKVLRKRRVAAGDVPNHGHSDDRWVASDAKLFNNKGDIVREIHPFFDHGRGWVESASLGARSAGPMGHYDPLGRVVRTTHPDGSVERTSISPWMLVHWDRNDTVLDADNRWYERHSAADALPEHQRAASDAAAHAGTPRVEHLDPRGRVFLVDEHERTDTGDRHLFTRTTLDVEGRKLSVEDARHNIIETDTHGYGDVLLMRSSPDAGRRWQLMDVAGSPFVTWDELGRRTRIEYDALRRPTRTILDTAGSTIVTALLEYGESLDRADAIRRNALGRLVESRDGAGVVRQLQYDFSGNLTHSERRLLLDFDRLPNWDDGLPVGLEPDALITTIRWDALGRATETNHPDGTIQHASWDDGGHLQRVDATLYGDTRPYLVDARYDAFGRRVRFTLGNGVRTTLTYDALSQRLRRIESAAGGDTLQDLRYDYDPVGNVTEVYDAAIEPVYFRNEVVEPRTTYTYSALYRLVAASGRESAAHGAMRGHGDMPWHDSVPAHDGALRNYTRTYRYDDAHNVVAMHHASGGRELNQTFTIAPDSNRLEQSVLDGIGTTYTHDPMGHMLALPHLPSMDWNHAGELAHTVHDNGEEVFFQYDASGQRIRKVRVAGTLREERIYLGPVEIFRRYRGTDELPSDVVWTHHMRDEQGLACVVETPTVQARTDLASPTPRRRWRLHDHLGSSTVELADDLTPLSYEQYYPYGTTSFRSRSASLSKRYRFTGMERDEETGLNVHGARYYVTWLTRWASADPIGIRGGPNLYSYASGNPVNRLDRSGFCDTQATANVTVGAGTIVEFGDIVRAISFRLFGTADFDFRPVGGTSGFLLGLNASLGVRYQTRHYGADAVGLRFAAGMGGYVGVDAEDLTVRAGVQIDSRDAFSINELTGRGGGPAISDINGRTGAYWLEVEYQEHVVRALLANNADFFLGDGRDDGLTHLFMLLYSSPWITTPDGDVRLQLALIHQVATGQFQRGLLREGAEGDTPEYQDTGHMAGRTFPALTLRVGVTFRRQIAQGAHINYGAYLEFGEASAAALAPSNYIHRRLVPNPIPLLPQGEYRLEDPTNPPAPVRVYGAGLNVNITLSSQ